MKKINQFILEHLECPKLSIIEKLKLYHHVDEKLTLSNQSKLKYNYRPKNVKDLRKLLEQLLEERGPNADLNDIDVSNIENMFYENVNNKRLNGLFRNLDIHNIDISNWDVSNCYNMSFLFAGCENFDCDLSKWKVDNVENMEKMFGGCKAFTGKGLDKWHVDSCRYMQGMFIGCSSLNDKNIEKWNVESVLNMHHMFSRCTNLDCDFSNWDVGNVRHMNYMFFKCIKFTGKGLDEWSVKDMGDSVEGMFEECYKLNVDLSAWENDVEINYEDMFYNCDNMPKDKLPKFVIVDF